MRKTILLSISFLLIGCSFQTRESEDLDERLSRKQYLEKKEVYSQINLEGEEVLYNEDIKDIKLKKYEGQISDEELFEKLSRENNQTFFENEN